MIEDTTVAWAVDLLWARGATDRHNRGLGWKGLAADIHDMEGFQALMASPPPEAAAVAESHGVLPPMAAYIEK